MYIDKYSDLWKHTVMRIENAENQAKSRIDFVQKMVTRLNRIKNGEKVHYAIEVLKERGYQDVVDIYDGRLLIEEMKSNAGQPSLNYGKIKIW